MASFSDRAYRRAVVLGAGASGRAAAALLRGTGCDVAVLEGEVSFPDAPCDVVVTSPGVPLDHPWQKAARVRGVPVVSELQLGVARYRARGGVLVAVTGSKGKSSVVKLVADALNGAGRAAVPCGNYGRPVCDVAASEAGAPLPVAVAEVSSFQLETTDLPPDAFAAAALLNLQDDHLDRHGTRAVYHALKRRLLTFTRRPFDFAGNAPVDAAACAALKGSYFDNPVLRRNGAAAWCILTALGVGTGEVRRAFAAFEPLPHRMQTVPTQDGRLWIDDSKATSLAALSAGVEMAVARSNGRKCHLIAGGLAKGDDPNFIIPCLQSGVKKVYLIGRCAESFENAWSKAVPTEMCGTLAAAVSAARRDAVSGEAVLLSPGTASFDQFKNFSERGDAFAALLQEQGIKK